MAILKEEINGTKIKNEIKSSNIKSTEYDTETKEQDKVVNYVQLLPLDNKSPDKTEGTKTKSGTKFIISKTNNPTLFWQAP